MLGNAHPPAGLIRVPPKPLIGARRRRGVGDMHAVCRAATNLVHPGEPDAGRHIAGQMGVEVHDRAGAAVDEGPALEVVDDRIHDLVADVVMDRRQHPGPGAQRHERHDGDRRTTKRLRGLDGVLVPIGLEDRGDRQVQAVRSVDGRVLGSASGRTGVIEDRCEAPLMIFRDGERLRRRHGLVVRALHEAPHGRLARSGGRAKEKQDNDGKSVHGVSPDQFET